MVIVAIDVGCMMLGIFTSPSLECIANYQAVLIVLIFSAVSQYLFHRRTSSSVSRHSLPDKMASGGRNVLVLYRVTNSDTDSADPLFNCFSMPVGNGATLNLVKQ